MSLPSPQNVTFVGIGAIGLPMAQQLAAAGFAVTGVDPFEKQRAAAAAVGITAESSPESASTADSVIVMVASPDQLRQAALGEAGLISRMQAGASLIVMSTVGPEPVKEVERAAAEHGVRVLDVPVTGGVAGARKGALRLFASGPTDVVRTNTALLSAMGQIIECGEEVGSGQSYKAVNQLLCSVHIVAAAEALALAKELGLDPQKTFDAVSGGAGASWMLSDRGPRMLEGLDAEVTSSIGIFVKDSTLVREIADSLGFDAPVLTAAQQKYLQASDAGLLHRDDSQVIQTYYTD